MKTQRFAMVDENGDEHGIDLPVKMEVCPDCDGDGVHVDPAVDGNGIASSEFTEDPEFKEAYFRGDYDVRCNVCKGLRVVPVVDRAHADKDDLALYDACVRAEEGARRFARESYLESLAERRFGS